MVLFARSGQMGKSFLVNRVLQPTFMEVCGSFLSESAARTTVAIVCRPIHISSGSRRRGDSFYGAFSLRKTRSRLRRLVWFLPSVEMHKSTVVSAP
jgi:hypothetical protein